MTLTSHFHQDKNEFPNAKEFKIANMCKMYIFVLYYSKIICQIEANENETDPKH